MVRIKLSKGLSYSGVVSATKKNPYVTTDEDTAKEAVASGYFEYVPEAVSNTTAENTEEIEEKKEDAPKADVKVQKSIDKMTTAELKAYAESKGIDISSCTNNEQRIALIKEIEEMKEDTMTPDFTQE